MNDSLTNTALGVVLAYVLLLLVAVGINADTSQLSIINSTSVLWLKASQVLSVIVTFVLPSILFVLLFTVEKWRYFLLHKFPSWKTIIIGVLIMPLALPFINAMGEFNNQISLPAVFSNIEIWMRAMENNAAILTEYFLKMDSVIDLAINLFVIAFMAAITEELFFRGVLQTVLIKATNIHIGVWGAAILFSAIHMQFYGFIPRAILGGVLGYMFIWSGSLWVPIIGHFVNNGAAVLLSYYIQKGAINKEIEHVGAAQDELFIGLASLVVTIGLLALLKRNTLHSSTFTQGLH